jgi:transcriptional regulator with XRE-family HTH domain
MTIGRKTKKALEDRFYPSKPSIRISTGEVLRILREKNELSQGKLAQKTHLTQATISSLENNRINLGIQRAKTLSKVLHVHPAVLVFPDLFVEAA